MAGPKGKIDDEDPVDANQEQTADVPAARVDAPETEGAVAPDADDPEADPAVASSDGGASWKNPADVCVPEQDESAEIDPLDERIARLEADVRVIKAKLHHM